ncbi:serine/threonine-protein kinase [Sorangium sp. So ce1504]|uniref:serine/threonine protein kinase n=1 Tax=Sorangium sp. So ce1504 TaxID=3133337 RepID=UPI003F618963
MLGELFGAKYRVIRLLGQGGMGAVYEAEHVETGERIALKCIDGTLVVPGKNGLQRFQREVKAMGAIDTEHTVRVLDAGTDPERKVPFMVMELLEGEDLQHLIDRVGSLEPDTALRIAAQVCLGLQKAHEARVVHRDIKPANLFLARRADGEIVVKILDFGIAKIKPEPSQGGPTTGLTRTGGILGSPLYMSPEQARGLSDIDYRTDIWSLGMVLYVSLAGALPHEHISAFGDLIMAICAQAPRSVQAFAPWVAPEVAAVVHGAIGLDTGERFPTAAAMLDAIRPLLPGGFALRDGHLVPVSPETRAKVAERFSLVHAADDAHRRIARIVVQGGIGGGDTTATVDAPGTAGGPTARAFNTTTADANIATSTTRDRESTPQARDTSAPRSRRPGKAAAAAGVVAAGGIVVAILVQWARQPQPGSLSVLGPAVSAEARLLAEHIGRAGVPPPASAPLSAVQRAKLRVAPADVSVEIDGRRAEVRGGEVAIEGAPGSRHQVRLVKGKAELRVEVIITDTGPSPASLQLDPEKPGHAETPGAKPPPGVKAPPGTKATGAQRGTGRPEPQRPPEPEDPLIPREFK